MKIGGVYVGLGEGDSSPEIANIKAFLKKKYTPARNTLDDGPDFTPALTSEVNREQAVFIENGALAADKAIPGVINLEFKYACGYLRRPVKPKPVIFTVEGHLSNMWVGPTASIASTLEQQGVCVWRPTGYDCQSLPFNNKDGVNQLYARVNATTYDDGKTFPPGTPWGVIGFSQGSMIVSEFMAKHVLPEDGALHWRLPDFKRGLALGNPRREFGKLAPWCPDPPKANTGGIMLDGEFVTTGTAIEGLWQENCNKGDMFAVNTNDEIGLDKAAIARIITENSWVGGPSAIFARVMALFAHVPKGTYAAVAAATEAIIFLASNPNPHYSTVAEPGDVSWMAGVAA